MNGTETDLLRQILLKVQALSITANTAIEYGAGATTAKTQRVAIATDANSVVFASPQAVTGTFWQATQPVSGSVSVSNFTDNGLTDTQLRASAVPVSGTVELGATSLAALENTTVTVSNPTAVGLTDTQLRASAVPVSVASSTASPTTSVASSATSTTLLALNTNRKYASFRNDSTSVAYVAKSATATTSSVYLLQPQGNLYFDDYTGVVTAIWVTANGFMQIEEGT